MVTVPALGLGISPLGPRIRPRRPTTPIISGSCHYHVEIQPSFVLDLRYQLLSAHILSACGQSLVSLGVLGEHQYPHLLAGSVGKHYSAADLLISVTAVASVLI